MSKMPANREKKMFSPNQYRDGTPGDIPEAAEVDLLSGLVAQKRTATLSVACEALNLQCRAAFG